MNLAMIKVAKSDGIYCLKFEGDIRLTFSASLDSYIDQIFRDVQIKGVVIDLNETHGIDSTCLGLLAKVSNLSKKQFHSFPTILSSNVDITRLLNSMGFDTVFNIMSAESQKEYVYQELEDIDVSEQEITEQVLRAHRTLMQLNKKNEEAFQDLVTALENERQH